MKITLLFSSFLLLSIISNAQVVVPRGTKMIGGSISVGSGRSNWDTSRNGQHPNTYRNFQTTFNPTFGWARKDNELYGIQLYSQFYTWKHESTSGISKGNYYAAGPGVFYERFFNLGKGFNFSANASLRATYGIQEEKTYANNLLAHQHNGKRYDVNLSVTPRIGYAFNSKWMVQASIGEMIDINYSHLNIKYRTSTGMTSQSKHNNLSLNTRLNKGLSLSNLGLTFRYSF